MRHTLCWNVPYTTPIIDKFQSLVEKVVLGCLKFFFGLDHRADFSLYRMKATTLHHSKELASLTLPLYIFSLINLSASLTPKSVSFHSCIGIIDTLWIFGTVGTHIGH